MSADTEAHTIPDHIADRAARLINEAEDMRQQAADDLKQIYADLREELRGMGWKGAAVSTEVAAFKGAISEMRMDEAAKEKREEKSDRSGYYISMLSRARARKGQSYAGVKGVNAGSSSGRIAEFDSADAGSNPAPVATQEQPETASQSETEAQGRGAPTVASAETVALCPSEYAGTSSDENPAPIPHSSEPSSSQAETKTSEAVVPPAASLVAIPDSDVPAFLRAEQAGKKDCLKLKGGHCKIPFETDALCADCENARTKARAGA